jgi:hypothetical protein
MRDRTACLDAAIEVARNERFFYNARQTGRDADVAGAD